VNDLAIVVSLTRFEFWAIVKLNIDETVVDYYISSHFIKAKQQELEVMKDEDKTLCEYQEVKNMKNISKDLFEGMKKCLP